MSDAPFQAQAGDELEDDKHSLEDVLIGMLMNGVDRGALVRPAQAGVRQPAVCALMLSEAAMMRLGGALLPLMKELGNSSEETSGPFSERAGLKTLFDQAEATGRHWVWFELLFGATKVRAVMFLGQGPCERAAAICSAQGAPCSLNAEKPAPGYQIERRLTQ
ncbi:MAG TPA: hypothetical protein VGO11_19825 [Chthoniobacteraceae bacterium]|jgi:hypothetical protein|nr:hypothetical protein [Chthoniobacteraceae bacterium]